MNGHKALSRADFKALQTYLAQFIRVLDSIATESLRKCV